MTYGRNKGLFVSLPGQTVVVHQSLLSNLTVPCCSEQ